MITKAAPSQGSCRLEQIHCRFICIGFKLIAFFPFSPPDMHDVIGSWCLQLQHLSFDSLSFRIRSFARARLFRRNPSIRAGLFQQTTYVVWDWERLKVFAHLHMVKLHSGGHIFTLVEVFMGSRENWTFLTSLVVKSSKLTFPNALTWGPPSRYFLDWFGRALKPHSRCVWDLLRIFGWRAKAHFVDLWLKRAHIYACQTSPAFDLDRFVFLSVSPSFAAEHWFVFAATVYSRKSRTCRHTGTARTLTVLCVKGLLQQRWILVFANTLWSFRRLFSHGWKRKP